MIARAVITVLGVAVMSGCASLTDPSREQKVDEWNRWIEANGGEPPARYTPYGTDGIEIRLSGVTDLPDLPYPGHINDWRSMTLVLRDGDLHGEDLSVLNTISRTVSPDYRNGNDGVWPRITVKLEDLNLHDDDLEALTLGETGKLFGPRRQRHQLSFAGNELTTVPQMGELGIEVDTYMRNRFNFSDNKIQTIERVGRLVRDYARYSNVELETAYNFSNNPVRRFSLDNDRVSLDDKGRIRQAYSWPWRASLIIKDENSDYWPVIQIPESGIDARKTLITGHKIQCYDDTIPAEAKEHERLGKVFVYRPDPEKKPQELIHTIIETKDEVTNKLINW